MKHMPFYAIALALALIIAVGPVHRNQAHSLQDAPTAAPASATPGGKIIFSSSNRPNNQFDLYSLDPVSLAITPITDSVLAEAYPAWSPDGEKIVFTGYVSGNHELFVLNADGTGLLQITTGLNCIYPQWSPDGKKISFVNYVAGHNIVYVINPDGSGATPLTPPEIEANYAVWSSDGSQIAYFAWQSDPVGIYTMDPDGENPTLLYAIQTVETMDWSPDGRYLVITDMLDHLVIRDLVNATSQTLTPASYIWQIDKAAWSPDGQHIVFDANSTIDGHPQNDIYRIDPDGTNLVPLTYDGAYDQMPDWGVTVIRLYAPVVVR